MNTCYLFMWSRWLKPWNLRETIFKKEEDGRLPDSLFHSDAINKKRNNIYAQAEYLLVYTPEIKTIFLFTFNKKKNYKQKQGKKIQNPIQKPWKSSIGITRDRVFWFCNKV